MVAPTVPAVRPSRSAGDRGGRAAPRAAPCTPGPNARAVVDSRVLAETHGRKWSVRAAGSGALQALVITDQFIRLEPPLQPPASREAASGFVSPGSEVQLPASLSHPARSPNKTASSRCAGNTGNVARAQNSAA